MTKKRDIEKLLDDGTRRAVAISPGLQQMLDSDGIATSVRRGALMAMRRSVAFGIIRDIAAETHDHWSVDSLREALRDIHYISQLLDADTRAQVDDVVMQDPATARQVLGLPDDADEVEIMRVLAERLKPPDDNPNEREKEPVL